MRLTSHITTNEKLLKSISEVRAPHDQKAPSLSIDQGFAVEIPNQYVYSEHIESENDVNCYTDGSKINEHALSNVPPTSVEVERVFFSVCGQFYTSVRSRLSAETIDMFVFN